MIEGSWESLQPIHRRATLVSETPYFHVPPLKSRRALEGRASSTDGGTGPFNRKILVWGWSQWLFEAASKDAAIEDEIVRPSELLDEERCLLL